MNPGPRRSPGSPGPAAARRADPVSKVQSSLLLKIMAALLVAVVGSSTLTAFLETRLARSALRAQARRVTSTNLRLLDQAFGGRERYLGATLRDLGQKLTADGHLEPAQHNALVGELGRAYRNLRLDTLQIVDTNGNPLEPAAGVGEPLAGRLEVSRLERRAPASRLIRLADGRWVQAIAIAIGPSPDGRVLVGGFDFGDAFAYELRQLLRDSGEIVLVARGEVVGTTLTDPPKVPPARGVTGRPLPTTPTDIRLDGENTLVAYRPVNAPAGGSGGALGVLLADPEAVLERSLSDARLLAAGLLAVLALALGWLFFRALVRPLVGLKETAGRIAEGDLAATFTASGDDEIAALARSLERMRRELRSQLDLIAAQAADLQDSSQRIVAAQDAERHRLARDLHDGIQQQLVVLRMGFGMAKEAAERGDGNGVAALEELSAELDAVIQRVREVSHDLYPSILVDRGLGPAVRTCVARLPLSTRLECLPDPLPRLPPEIESGAYFLVCEALANALKHSDASEITLHLEVRDGWLEVLVRDDGCGFAAADPRAVRSGGLLHMDDRARSFGGDLRIESAPGSGTSVVARFPVRAEAGVGPGG